MCFKYQFDYNNSYIIKLCLLLNFAWFKFSKYESWDLRFIELTADDLTFSSELKMFLKIERHFLSWKCFHFAQIKLNWRYILCMPQKIKQYSSQLCILVKKLLNIINITFLFSPFRSNIESIDINMYLHGFWERMFSVQEQCTWIFLSVYL